MADEVEHLVEQILARVPIDGHPYLPAGASMRQTCMILRVSFNQA